MISLTSVISRFASPLLNFGIAGEDHANVAPVNTNATDAETPLTGLCNEFSSKWAASRPP